MAVLDLNEDFDDLGLEILDLIDVLTVKISMLALVQDPFIGDTS